MSSSPSPKKTDFKIPVIVFSCLTIIIISIGTFAFKLQRDQLNQFAKEQLEGIANLKVQQITSWQQERLIDASYIFNNTFFIDEIDKWKKNKSNEFLKAKIRNYLIKIHGQVYDHACLIDENFAFLVSDSTYFDHIDPKTLNTLKTACRQKSPELSDIYLNEKTGQVLLDLAIPLFSNSTLSSVVLLQLNPQNNLFPIIQKWPTPSRSAETLLAEKVNNRVVYLNELRHVHNTPLKLIVSMTDTNILAVKGFRGQLGSLEGKDYRGIPVLGATVKVPGTSWIVVAKMDQSETDEPIYRRAVLTFIPVLLIIIFAGIIIFSQWKNQQRLQYTQLLESELAKQKAEMELIEREESLRETRNYLENLLHYANVPIIVWDQSLNITQFNRAFEILSGYTSDEVLQKNIDLLFPESEREKTIAVLEDLKSGRKLETAEILIRRKNNSLCTVLWNSANIYAKDGITISATIAQGTDITDRIKAEASLRQTIIDLKNTEQQLKGTMQFLERSNKELEQFAYVASHDLQEPLRMVSSYTQLLAKKYKDVLDSNAIEYIDFAVDGAQRMQQLINDLLDYSRVTKQDKPVETVNSSRVLGLAIVNLRKKIEESCAIITNDQLPVVMANESQLVRVFQNLIDNAIKYHGTEFPAIHISARPENGGYLFSFCDNGIGIDPEYKDRIFEIFERLHSGHSYPGTGIGLAICKKIIEKHGGKIWVEPNKQQGVTFYFTLKKGTE